MFWKILDLNLISDFETLTVALKQEQHQSKNERLVVLKQEHYQFKSERSVVLKQEHHQSKSERSVLLRDQCFWKHLIINHDTRTPPYSSITTSDFWYQIDPNTSKCPSYSSHDNGFISRKVISFTQSDHKKTELNRLVLVLIFHDWIFQSKIPILFCCGVWFKDIIVIFHIFLKTSVIRKLIMGVLVSDCIWGYGEVMQSSSLNYLTFHKQIHARLTCQSVRSP